MNKKALDFSPKTIPLPHQIEAIQYVSSRNETALFDEQGLGKTKIVIDSLCKSMEKNEIDAVLVIAPLSLVFVWEEEVIKHSNLLPIVLRGNEREKRYKYLTGANFYITNYESVVSQLERIKRFCRSRKLAIVLDEATRIKDPKTQAAKSIFELRNYSSKRIVITGTPIANSPIDIWSLYYFLDKGKLLGEAFGDFKEEYNEKSQEYINRLNVLKSLINNNSIRRVKKDVLELPEKTYINIPIELTGKQLSLYEDLRKDLRIEITNLRGDLIIDEAENILKKLLRLIQIASNPQLIDKSYNEEPVKFYVLKEIINKIIEKGEKAIIWSCFVENIFILKNRFKHLSPLLIHGEVPSAERAVIVRTFQETEKNKLIIANPAAAREGITLTRANNAIYLDRNFSLQDYLQSQDRIHRISQNKACNIFKLIATGTIDEYVDRIIDFKQDIARFVQTDIAEINKTSTDTLMNRKTLLSILGG